MRRNIFNECTSKLKSQFCCFSLTALMFCNSVLATLYEEPEKPKDAVEYPKVKWGVREGEKKREKENVRY